MPKMVGNGEPGAVLFKIMLGSFSKMLQVPLAFIHDTGMQTCAVQEVTMKSQDGEKIARCFYFCGDGWEEFVLCQGLELQDFVVFRLIGERVFEFLTFDKSSCQKGLPWTSSAAGHDEGSKTESSPLPPSSPSLNPLMQLPLSSSLEMPLLSDAAAISHSGHPWFMVTLQSYNARFMHVPREFAIQVELLMKKFTVMKDSKGRMWTVRLSRYYHGSTRHVSFSVGWPDLFKANEFAIGMSCLFTFVPGTDDSVYVEVL